MTIKNRIKKCLSDTCKFAKQALYALLAAVLLTAAGGCTTAESYGPDETELPSEAKYASYQYNQERSQSLCRSGAAIREDGYYYNSGNILHYYDIDSGLDTPLCTRGNCNHAYNTKSCDAYIYDTDSSSSVPSANCLGSNILYYDNRLYLLERTEEDEEILYQYDKNFNNKEKIAALATPKNKTVLSNLNKVIIADGYLYYMVSTLDTDNKQNMTYHANRIRLEPGSEAEELASFSWTATCDGTVNILASGNKIYYVGMGMGALISWEAEYQFYWKLCSYDTTTGVFHTVCDERDKEVRRDVLGKNTGIPIGTTVINCCADSSGNCYLFTKIDGEFGVTGGNDKYGIVKINMENGNARVIAEIPELSNSTLRGKELLSDGQYLYLYYDNKLTAYDSEGNLIAGREMVFDESFIAKRGDSLPTGMNVSVYMVDDRYIMLAAKDPGIKGLLSKSFQTLREEVPYGVGLLDKQDFLSGKDSEILQIYSRP